METTRISAMIPSQSVKGEGGFGPAGTRPRRALLRSDFPYKGVDLLVEAFARLIWTDPTCTW